MGSEFLAVVKNFRMFNVQTFKRSTSNVNLARAEESREAIYVEDEQQSYAERNGKEVERRDQDHFPLFPRVVA